ncbi:glycosyltransferase [Rouxiella badensis]|uniref:glycosyltransferase n=1 Tax=Rouxiella badensis TaxID=1646377 RepID=UPI0013EF037C|nr:glycosyltransferase [Rouxiella badensis]MCC3733300.1 glycosyltransferase [Rouxiella badensis]MCC3758049.1 glycosyltransferase [Rouxiella badensis]QII36380.1 glycosyltransferase [Rouxiella badensis]WAT08724.1 glycosyltransferase [Rouxiella badensis]
MESLPLITIYIISYKRLDLLKRCIDAARKQTYKNVEIIVVDDNSGSEIADYLESIAEIDDRVSFFINDQNRGACFSRNVAIVNAKGIYITGCDDDDFFEEDRVQRFYENSSLLEKYCFLYTGNKFKISTGIKTSKIDNLSPDVISTRELIYFNAVGNQVFIKTELLKKYKFDITMPAWQDFDCWYRILAGEKKKARKIDYLTLVQDVSHGGDRISSSKVEKIKKAFSLFKNKNNLTSIESVLLENHLRNYFEGKKMFFKSLFYMVVCRFSFLAFIIFSQAIIKYVKSGFRRHTNV